MEKAKLLIDIAAESGADAVKFQTFKYVVCFSYFPFREDYYLFFYSHSSLSYTEPVLQSVQNCCKGRTQGEVPGKDNGKGRITVRYAEAPVLGQGPAH